MVARGLGSRLERTFRAVSAIETTLTARNRWSCRAVAWSARFVLSARSRPRWQHATG